MTNPDCLLAGFAVGVIVPCLVYEAVYRWGQRSANSATLRPTPRKRPSKPPFAAPLASGAPPFFYSLPNGVGLAMPRPALAIPSANCFYC